MADERDSDDDPRPQGTTSVRVVIGVCLGSMFVLAAMAVYWLMIRL